MAVVYIFIPLLTAFAGWLSVRLLLPFLFRPVLPQKILGATVQGILPAAIPALAEAADRLVKEELLSPQMIGQKVANPANLEKVMPLVEEQVENFLRVKLPAKEPMLAMFLSDKLIAQFKGIFVDEVKTLFPNVLGNYAAGLKSQLDIRQLILEKMGDGSRLEQLVRQRFGRQLNLAAIAGGGIGLAIGLIQILIIHLSH